jgi:hypothetical protein
MGKNIQQELRAGNCVKQMGDGERNLRGGSMADIKISSDDKKLLSEIEHDKHGPEYYRHPLDTKDVKGPPQDHTVHNNPPTEHPPHAQHGGPDERPPSED